MTPGPIASLTARQRQVLDLVLEGTTQSKDIARAIGIAPKSVDNFLASAAKILGVSGREEAARAYADALKNYPGAYPGIISGVEAVPESGLSDPDSAGRQAIAGIKRFFRGIPLGGEKHSLDMGQLLAHMVRIAALSLIALTLLLLLILAVFETFR